MLHLRRQNSAQLEYGRGKNVQQKLPLQYMNKLVAPEQVVNDNGQNRRRIKRLHLKICIHRPAAIGEGIPQGQLAVLDRFSQDRGERKMKVTEIPGNDVAAAEQHAPVKGESLGQQ